VISIIASLLSVGLLSSCCSARSICFNLLFAAIYFTDPGGIAHARPGSFGDAFFFSVQSMATVGFGNMHPADLFTNLVVTVAVLLGIVTIASATALVFSRFSRPTARVMFSEIAGVAPHDGVPTLMFRAANRRRNQTLEAHVAVSLLRDEVRSKVKRCAGSTTWRLRGPGRQSFH
jgi:inward rectifier potassium channel